MTGHFENGKWVEEPTSFHVWDIKRIIKPVTCDNITIVELSNGTKITIDAETSRGRATLRQLRLTLPIYLPEEWDIY